MSWQTDMTTILRAMLDDLDSATYTDEKLKKMLVVAAFQVVNQLTFSPEFVISVSAQTITPDPTDEDSKNESFINLVTQKAACILDRSSAIIAARRAIAVKDGSSAIDLRGVLEGKLSLLAKGGWCSVFDDTKLEYQSGAATIAGAVVMTPFRVQAVYTESR